MLVAFTWHDAERKPINRSENHEKQSFSISFALEDGEAFCDLKDRISACSGIPARWISVDSFSKMIASTGNEISKKAFIGYMNRYAWQMKQYRNGYPEELEAACSAWDNLVYLAKAYDITTAEAIAIRENPDPYYWAK